MALYRNMTRFEAIVTINITAILDKKKVLQVGLPSAKSAVSADVGVHDVRVGPGESLDLEEGVEAQFLAARGV